METQSSSELLDLSRLKSAFDQSNRLTRSLNNSIHQISQSVHRLSASSPTSPASMMLSNVNGQELIDAIPGAILILDPQGNIANANVAAIHLIGEPLLNQSWRQVLSRVFLDELDQGELKTRDGRQFSISTQPLGFHPGQMLLLGEVTATRNLQKAAQQNLHLVSMGKMMASLAHQIRTPLASTMLYLSQLVKGESNTTNNKKFSEKALSRVRHIESLINDMLVFAHGGQFKTSRFSIRSLLDELRDQLAAELDSKKARLIISRDIPDVELHGNRQALLGVFANLCINGIQATDGPAVIIINARINRFGQLSLLLRDNGQGFDMSERKHIFDPFYSTKETGSGLGLAVVKSVIESHQGHVAVASRPGSGTRFKLFLPCHESVKTQISGKH
jgi:two-component system, sensor histidine kinase FlrB